MGEFDQQTLIKSYISIQLLNEMLILIFRRDLNIYGISKDFKNSNSNKKNLKNKFHSKMNETS